MSDTIPPPPRPPSFTAEKIKAWGAAIAAVTGLIMATGTAIATSAGAFSPDMSENTRAVRELTSTAQAIQRWIERHEDKHDTSDQRALDRAYEVDRQLDRLEATR